MRKIAMIVLSVVLVSLLLVGGCSGKTNVNKVDMTTPPPLPDEAAAENEQSSAPPALPSGQESEQQSSPPSVPLLS